MNRREVGRAGEDLAVQALTGAGYTILERNYRRRTGEIDIVAREGEVLAFVEVKARSSRRYGSPAEAVGRVKQRRIIQAARLYLAEHGLEEAPCRFDVVEVLQGRVNLLKGAFDATED